MPPIHVKRQIIHIIAFVGVLLSANLAAASSELSDPWPILDNCTEATEHREDYRLPRQTALEAAGLAELPPNGYLSVDVLLVIYTHSFCDTISQPEVEHIVSAVEKGREFYARNSFCRLNVNIADVAVIDRLLTLDQFKQESDGRYSLTYWEVDGVHSVRNDLYDLGYQDSQFGAVFVFFTWKNTAGIRISALGRSYGVRSDFLNSTSYAWVNHNHDPTSTDFYFVHEFHHQLDNMFKNSGLPEYPHADRYEDYDHAVFDDGRSFNGWMLRDWPRDNWELMHWRWGTVLTFDDFDGDGLPDHDPSLAIDEFRFGSSFVSTDTDGDGLSDLEEFAAGHMASTDPSGTDTDDDGQPDAEDEYPLDRVNPVLLPGGMIIDGVVDSLTTPHIVSFGSYYSTGATTNLYGSYSDTGIYLCFDVTDNSVYVSSLGVKYHDGVRLRLDAQSDGFLAHGDDNYLIYLVPQGDFAAPLRRVEIILDDDSRSLDYVPDTDLIAAYSLTDSGYCIEMFLRENSLTSFNVEDGLSIRMQCDVLDRNLEVAWPGGARRGNAFTEFVSFEFASDVTDVDDNAVGDVLPGDFELSQNYPNPFNPATTISYSLTERSQVSIDIFNILGRRVVTLLSKSRAAGHHAVTWDGRDAVGRGVATGVYLYRLRAGEHVETKKMLLLK